MIKSLLDKHPSIWRYISVIAILIVILPVIFITYYLGDIGKYIGMGFYILFSFLAIREVSKAVGLSWWTQIFLAALPSVMFIYPWDAINPLTYFKEIPKGIGTFLHWIPFIIISLGTFIILFDPKLSKGSASPLMKVVIIFSSVLIVSIFTKFSWIMNMANLGQYVYMLSIAIVADSFAYLGGKYCRQWIFNAKKLAPKISPKKTWAGFIIGSVIASIFIGVVGYYIHAFDNSNHPIVILVLLSLLLPVVSAFGDLLFSYFKRKLHIKDFSNLIPGHGGIMDRIDAISTVISIIALVFYLFNI